MLSPYLMGTDARARRAAKELRTLTKEFDVGLSLQGAQDVVGRLLGHADWRAFLATVGSGHSADDVQAGIDVASKRHEAQRSVLVSLGLSSDQAERVRARLSLTGRSGRDADARELIPMQKLAQYHPTRLFDAVERVCQFREERAEYNVGGAPSTSLASIWDDLENWADDVELVPGDDAVVNTDAFENLYDDARRVLVETRCILDAAACARRLSTVPLGGTPYSGEWDGMPKTYVHFGTNAFPSPFPGCGIEGCYVTIQPPVDGWHRRVDMTFVASPETAPDLDTGEEMTLSAFDDLLFSVRHVSLSVEGERPDDPVTVSAISDASNTSELDDEFVDLWRPHLAGPVAAAWNAIRAEREATMPCHDGVLSDIGEDTMRRLLRARTPAQRQTALRRLQEDDGEYLVRFVGGPNPEATDPRHRTGRPSDDVCSVAVSEPLAWAVAYVRMASEAALPEAEVALADKALVMVDRAALDLSDEDDGDRTNLDEVRVFALAHKAEGLSDRKRFDEAFACARRAMDLDRRDGLGMRFRAGALAVAAGDEVFARGLLTLFADDDQAGPWAEWTRALILARFGTDDERDEALDAAMREDDDVARRLLADDRHRERWLDRDMVEEHGTAWSICGAHRDAWRTVPGRERILAEAVARYEVPVATLH